VSRSQGPRQRQAIWLVQRTENRLHKMMDTPIDYAVKSEHMSAADVLKNWKR
jgi:hypothetical protein